MGQIPSDGQTPLGALRALTPPAHHFLCLIVCFILVYSPFTPKGQVDKDKGNRPPPLRASPSYRKSSAPSLRCALFSGCGSPLQKWNARVKIICAKIEFLVASLIPSPSRPPKRPIRPCGPHGPNHHPLLPRLPFPLLTALGIVATCSPNASLRVGHLLR